jgi:hypothetical protein
VPSSDWTCSSRQPDSTRPPASRPEALAHGPISDSSARNASALEDRSSQGPVVSKRLRATRSRGRLQRQELRKRGKKKREGRACKWSHHCARVRANALLSAAVIAVMLSAGSLFSLSASDSSLLPRVPRGVARRDGDAKGVAPFGVHAAPFAIHHVRAGCPKAAKLRAPDSQCLPPSCDLDRFPSTAEEFFEFFGIPTVSPAAGGGRRQSGISPGEAHRPQRPQCQRCDARV